MPQTIVYVACSASREICIFDLDLATASLNARASFATKNSPSPIKAAANQRVLYVGMRPENSAPGLLQALAIDPQNGQLSALGQLATQGGPTYIACDQTRQLAFVAAYHDNNLGVFSLAENGSPVALCQTVTHLPRAHAVMPDLSNRWLLVPTLGADALAVFRLDLDAKRSPTEQTTAKFLPEAPTRFAVQAGSGPRHVVFAPDNAHLYCINELAGTIDSFAFDSTSGELQQRASSPLCAPNLHTETGAQAWAAELRISANGQFLYATERRDSVIVAFSVNAQNGQLRLIDHYPTETQPRGMQIDPSGQVLLASGQLSHQISAYRINPENGRLSFAQRAATGQDPISIEIVSL